MAQGSGLSAQLNLYTIPELENLDVYMDQFTIPAITYRNWNSYGHLIQEPGARELHLGCDPQTSGGLLIAIDEKKVDALLALFKENEIDPRCWKPIGKMVGSSVEEGGKIISF